MGIVNARIGTEPAESQFPNKPKWVAIEINGEERYYNCENSECELALTGLKDQHITLEARGSREEATLLIGASDASPPDEKPVAGKVVAEKPNGGDKEKIEQYASHSLRVFLVAWDKAKDVLKTIPEADAVDLSASDWLDLRMRAAAHIAIEVGKILRRERF